MDLPEDIMKRIQIAYSHAFTGGSATGQVDARRVIKTSETDKRVEVMENSLGQRMGRMEDLLIALQTGKSSRATNDRKRLRTDTAEVTEHQAKRPTVKPVPSLSLYRQTQTQTRNRMLFEARSD
ncbi:hypothetical protein AB5N19_06800 [Seiridium cardinale]